MRNRLTKIMMAIAAMGVAAVSPIAAQEAAPPAETPRCGGLLCDMGMFGPGSEKTTLPCNDFVCRAFGGGQAEAAPPPAAVPEPVPERKTVAKARKQHAKVARKEAEGRALDATVPDKR